jgi:putative transposase
MERQRNVRAPPRRAPRRGAPGREAGQAKRLEFVLVDKGVPKKTTHALTKEHPFEVHRYGWAEKPIDPVNGEKMFKPLKYSWCVEAAHAQVGRSRRLAESFENTSESSSAWLQLACRAMSLNAIE